MISPEDPRPYVDVPIAGTEMTFKSLLDSGSTSSIMTVEQYRELGKPQPFFARPQHTVTASDKSGLSILGEARIALTIGEHTKEVQFHIAENCTQGCILGQDVANDFHRYVYSGGFMTRSELKTYAKDTDKGVLAARRYITLLPGQFSEGPEKAYETDRILNHVISKSIMLQTNSILTSHQHIKPSTKRLMRETAESSS